MKIGAFSVAGRNLTIPTAWQAWAAMIGLGLSASVAALALFQVGVFLCGEVKASLLSTFEPLTGVVIGIVVFHESLTAPIAAGVLLILCLAILLVISPKEKQRGYNMKNQLDRQLVELIPAFRQLWDAFPGMARLINQKVKQY